MFLRIRQDLDVPIYQQIVDQIKAQVADGTILKDERLPAVRELAADLNVNVNTVYKAYKELEAQSVVRMRVGRGATVISERQEHILPKERERIVRDMINRLRVEAYHLGFDDNYLIKLLQQKPKEQAG